MLIQKLPEKNIAEWVRKVAHENNVSDEPDKYAKMALTITSLSGDDIAVTSTDTIIMNLHKNGFINKKDALRLISMNFIENKSKKYSCENPSSEPH